MALAEQPLTRWEEDGGRLVTASAALPRRTGMPDPKEIPMTLPALFIIVAALLFLLSTIPKIQQPWMVAIGLALFSCSFLPFFDRRLN